MEHYLGAARELSREIGGFSTREKAGQGLEQAREAWGVVKERLGIWCLGLFLALKLERRSAVMRLGRPRRGKEQPPEGSFMDRHRARPAETMSGPGGRPSRREREGAFLDVTAPGGTERRSRGRGASARLGRHGRLRIFAA